ncbi:MAG: stage II sporulation protein M [Patescibacteria group bacterium]|jgi:stage II sporulation protein M|nr:stage II sporulation protein M [Patescibacteria group bacterium]
MNIKKIQNYYRGLLKHKKLRKYFKFSSILFIIFFILGFLFASKNKEASQVFFEALSDKYLFAVDYNFLQLFLFIFKNNLLIAFIAYSSGFIFGLPTLFILVINSFVIGLVVKIATYDLGIFSIIFSMLPHGIFEIPAILLALSLGFILGDSLFGFLFKKKSFKKEFIFSLKLFFYLVVPLLFIAALVESGLIVLFA